MGNCASNAYGELVHEEYATSWQCGCSVESPCPTTRSVRSTKDASDRARSTGYSVDSRLERLVERLEKTLRIKVSRGSTVFSNFQLSREIPKVLVPANEPL